MTTSPCYQRLFASGLSRWELGDFLGLHPHELALTDRTVSLNDQPVRVVAELAARLDMHPADLAGDLVRVLSNRRIPITPTAEPQNPASEPEADALVVLTALATISVPLTLDELATALSWSLERTDTAIGHAQQHPALAGPSALRRVPPQRWTLTARLDVLTLAQRRNLDETTHYRTPLSDDEAAVLLTAYAVGNTPGYTTWRQDHLIAEHALNATGLLQSYPGPQHTAVHPDVRYSLDRTPDAAWSHSNDPS